MVYVIAYVSLQPQYKTFQLFAFQALNQTRFGAFLLSFMDISTITMSVIVPLLVATITGVVTFYINNIKTLPLLNQRIASLEKKAEEYKTYNDKTADSVHEKDQRLSVVEEEIKHLTANVAELSQYIKEDSKETRKWMTTISESVGKISVEVSHLKK